MIFKYFLKIFWKKKNVFLPFFGVFFLISIITMPRIGPGDKVFRDPPMTIGIVEKKESDFGRAVKELLKDQNIKEIAAGEDFRQEVLVGEYDLVLEFDDRPDERIEQGREAVTVTADPTNDAALSYRMKIDQLANLLHLSNGDVDKAEQVMKEEVGVRFSDRTTEEDAGKWIGIYARFSGYILSSVMITGLGLSISDFNEPEIRRRNNVSGTGYRTFAGQLYGGQAVVALLLTGVHLVALLLMMRHHLDKIPFGAYGVNMLLLSFSVYGFSNLVTTLTGNANLIVGIGNILPLGLSFISGVFVPTIYLPKGIVAAAKFFPLYHFIQNLDETTVSALANKHSLFLLFFGALALLLSLYFKREGQAVK